MKPWMRRALVIAAVIGPVACTSQAAQYQQSERIASAPRADEQSPRAVRQALLAELKPVSLTNCTFKRFGSPNDGGYVMCASLLEGVETAYSYGIGGNDDWGCEISRTRNVPVHQYDCFNPPNLVCDKGRFVPHAECVGAKTETVKTRFFDTISNQISKNGDRGKRIVVKIDVEGAEWDSLRATPAAVLERFDQLPMELHGTSDARFLEVVQKLKRQFYLVHLHFNNWACTNDEAPFPSRAFQVLWVNKRVGVAGPPPSGSASATSFDAPDNPAAPECQQPSSPQ